MKVNKLFITYRERERERERERDDYTCEMQKILKKMKEKERCNLKQPNVIHEKG